MEKLRINIPTGLLFIAVFYTFGVVVLVIFLLADPIQTSNVIAKVHELPGPTGN